MSTTNCSHKVPTDHRQVECIAVGHFIYLPFGTVPDYHYYSAK